MSDHVHVHRTCTGLHHVLVELKWPWWHIKLADDIQSHPFMSGRTSGILIPGVGAACMASLNTLPRSYSSPALLGCL